MTPLPLPLPLVPLPPTLAVLEAVVEADLDHWQPLVLGREGTEDGTEVRQDLLQVEDVAVTEPGIVLSLH